MGRTPMLRRQFNAIEIAKILQISSTLGVRGKASMDYDLMRRMANFRQLNNDMSNSVRMRSNRKLWNFDEIIDDLEDGDMLNSMRRYNSSASSGKVYREMLEMIRSSTETSEKVEINQLELLVKIRDNIAQDQKLCRLVSTFKMCDGTVIANSTEGKTDPNAWLRRARDSKMYVSKIDEQGETTFAPLHEGLLWLLEHKLDEECMERYKREVEPIREQSWAEFNLFEGDPQDGIAEKFMIKSCRGRRMKVQVKFPIVEVPRSRQVPMILSLLDDCIENKNALMGTELKLRDMIIDICRAWLYDDDISESKKFILLMKLMERKETWIRVHQMLAGRIDYVQAVKANCTVCSNETLIEPLPTGIAQSATSYRQACLVKISQILNRCTSSARRFEEFKQVLIRDFNQVFRVAIENAAVDEQLEVCKAILGLRVKRLKSYGQCLFRCLEKGVRSSDLNINNDEVEYFKGSEVWIVTDKQENVTIKVSILTNSFLDYKYRIAIDQTGNKTEKAIAVINCAAAYFLLNRDLREDIMLNGTIPKASRYSEYSKRGDQIRLETIQKTETVKEALTKDLVPVSKSYKGMVVAGLFYEMIADVSGGLPFTNFTVQDFKIIEEDGSVWSEMREMSADIGTGSNINILMEREDDSAIWELLLIICENARLKRNILVSTLASCKRIGKLVIIHEFINCGPAARKSLRRLCAELGEYLSREFIKKNKREAIEKCLNRAFFLMCISNCTKENAPLRLPESYILSTYFIDSRTMPLKVEITDDGKLKVEAVWAGSLKADSAVHGYIMNNLGFSWTSEPCSENFIFDRIPTAISEMKHIGLASKTGVSYYRRRLGKRHLPVKH